MEDAVFEDFLAHYGVVGMKWGKRGAGMGTTGPSRQELKTLDKTARLENKAEKKANIVKRDGTILKARDLAKEQHKGLKVAKRQFKDDKYQIGKVAAKKILDKHKDEYLKNLDVAQQRTHKEQTQDLMFAIGGIALKTLVNARTA